MGNGYTREVVGKTIMMGLEAIAAQYEGRLSVDELEGAYVLQGAYPGCEVEESIRVEILEFAEPAELNYEFMIYVKDENFWNHGQSLRHFMRSGLDLFGSENIHLIRDYICSSAQENFQEFKENGKFPA